MGGRNRTHERNGVGMGASLQSGRSTSIVLSPYRGTLPLFVQEQVAQIVQTVTESEPIDHALAGHNWNLKKIGRWLQASFACAISRTALRTLLQKNGLSWKKCQKLLKRANPAKRAIFMQEFHLRFAQVCSEEIRLVYVDESHFHRDLEVGCTWSPKGKPAWRGSDCPPLSDRINWYGAYDFNQGQCFLWHEGACNQDNTIQFLHHLVAWRGDVTTPVVIIWDGAPWHRAKRVQAAAAELGLTLLPLPGYSPDLNPIEGLWKWMRQEVTQNHCHASLRHLFDACKAFIDRINADPQQTLARLWPKFHLDPDYEKLLLSI
jgi:transposase